MSLHERPDRPFRPRTVVRADAVLAGDQIEMFMDLWTVTDTVIHAAVTIEMHVFDEDDRFLRVAEVELPPNRWVEVIRED